MKLNPAVCTGLIYAGVHQAFAIVGVAGLWTNDSWLFFLTGLVLAITDFPVMLAMKPLGLDDWHPPALNFLPRPNDLFDDSQLIVSGLVTSIFILGALQWFLIGYAAGVRRSEREQKQQNSV
jgi:uncharacterized membrane protein YuzA (DUF378 family)